MATPAAATAGVTPPPIAAAGNPPPSATKSPATAPPPAPLDMLKIRPFTNFQSPSFLIQGTLEKESVGLLTSAFKRFFFRMDSTNLTYYTSVQACSWGFVPIDERGVIPIALITRLEETPVTTAAKTKETEFELYVTNAENNRYPGRNHARKDDEFERVYRFNAMDMDCKDLWCAMIKDCMGGKFQSVEDLTMRFKGKQEAAAVEGGGEMKTNLGRFLKAGDDWDELPIMTEAEMLKVKEAELLAAVGNKTMKYKVKDVKGVMKNKAKLEQNKHPVNDNNQMRDKRHMTVVEKPKKEEAGGPEAGIGGCGCLIS